MRKIIILATSVLMTLSILSIKAFALDQKNILENTEKQVDVNLIENKETVDELDDGELNITMEEFLEEKKYNKNNIYLEKTPEQKIIKINKEVSIIDTNLKWNGDLDLSNKPQTIVLHHIEASRENSTIPITDVHQWHLNNGWVGIGYHFYITKDGKIYRGRPEEAIGAHAKNNNKNSLGIAVEGKYGIEEMPEIQKNSIINLGKYLRRKYHINNIVGHGEVNPTDCPGKKYPLTNIKLDILKHPINEDKDKKPLYSQSFGIKYAAHGQDYDWQNYVNDGQTAGTTGQYRRMEAIKINLVNSPQELNLHYRTHSEGDSGWSEWKDEGEIAGTTGESKRMEAIQIKLEGKMAKNYSVEYRVHGEDYEWQKWVKDGETAGTLGEWKRIEAIEIKIVESNKLGVKYSAQGEDYGWQDYVSNGQLAGTSSQYRRLEGLKIKLVNNNENISLRYRAHIEGDGGFQEWTGENQLTGSSGKWLRMEALQIELVGEDAENYDIEYRAHVENYGWQPWVKNGQTAGTLGEWKRMEGVEIRIIEK